MDKPQLEDSGESVSDDSTQTDDSDSTPDPDSSVPEEDTDDADRDPEAEGTEIEPDLNVEGSSPTLRVVPSQSNQFHDLSCTGLPDSDDGTGQWRWRVNGTPTEHTGAVLSAEHTRAGQRWSCEYLASDGTTHRGTRRLNTGFTDITTSYEHACGVVPAQRDLPGDVVCWGELGGERWSRSGEFVSIHLEGESYVCALDADGQASCWNHQSDFQTPEEELSTIQMDDSFACGVQPDGAAVCWVMALDHPSVPLTVWRSTDADPALRFSHIIPHKDLAGSRMACGILAETGEVSCRDPQAAWVEVESGLETDGLDERFIDISGGHYSICAVTDRGDVHCFDGEKEVLETGGLAQLSV